MRDPERIHRFLQELELFWSQYPDQRFGQLIMNISRVDGGFEDIWEWDVDEFRRRMVSINSV